MNQIPLLILSDSPSLKTGLGRITRDLASFVASMPEYRVGVLGRGGIGSRQLPFTNYNFPEVGGGWGENVIEHVWNDFAGNTKGVIMTIWDASRLAWFSCPHPSMGSLHDFLTSGRFVRWGYFPIDGEGPNGKLSVMQTAAINGFDRVLGYTAWGAGVIERSIGRSVDWIPHGYNADKFQPRDRKAARMAFGFNDDDIVIGMNATNQTRKDWGVAFSAIADLRQRMPSVRFLINIDTLSRHWDITALTLDYGLQPYTKVNIAGSMNDEELSYWYSGCDLTILPSTEGLGYPIIESMACGVPVLHGSYGGGVELIPQADWIVPSVVHHLETVHDVYRPIWDPIQWSMAIEKVLGQPRIDTVPMVEHLKWSNLWPSAWKKWFLEGAK